MARIEQTLGSARMKEDDDNGFVSTPEDVARWRARETWDYYGAELLSIVWETSPATIERLLPPPLKPAKRPLALAMLANYPRTSFGVTYQEAVLALQAEFEGVEGSYYLAMPVTDDMALIGGREISGFPKKIARIAFYHEGQTVGGWAERHGIRYFSAQAQLTGTVNAPEASDALFEVLGAPGGSGVSVNYTFKCFLSPDWQSFDYPPRLVRMETVFQPQTIEFGEATVTLTPSDFDPWSEVDVKRMLGTVYAKGDLFERKGKVVAEVDSEAFMPYYRAKLDPLG